MDYTYVYNLQFTMVAFQGWKKKYRHVNFIATELQALLTLRVYYSKHLDYIKVYIIYT